MSRPVMIMVCDNHDTIEKTRQYCQTQDVTLQVYSSTQWREGMDNVFFRQQLLQGAPALAGGSNPVVGEFTGGNVVQFPVNVNNEPRVQKMEELEAKAIEDAITQYKGNLTEAAKALGIGRATLYRKVKQYQIDPSSARRRRAA